MSLKSFHLLFISCAVLLALLCAGLAIVSLIADRAMTPAAALVASAGAAVLLVRYEAGFLRQCRERGIR